MKATIDEFIDLLKESIDGLDEVEFDSNTALKDLEQWDSLARLTVIALADGEYDIVIAASDLRKCKTVGDLHRLVCG